MKDDSPLSAEPAGGVENGTTVRPKTMTIQSIRHAYDGNWVLVSVTGYDEMHYPHRGKVLADSPDRMEIHEAFVREKEAQKPGAKRMYYIFLAEPHLTSGPELDKAAARIVGSLRRVLARERARLVR